MSTHSADSIQPRPLSPRRYARNGRLPAGALARQLAEHHNHFLAYRRKNVFAKSLNINRLDTQMPGGAGVAGHWRGRFWAGVGARRIEAVVGMAKALAGGGPSGGGLPYVDILVTNPDSSQVATEAAAYAAVDSGAADTLDEFNWAKIVYELPEDNGAYSWVLRAHNHARPFALGLYEVAGSPVDTDAGALASDVAATAPIFDEWHEQLTESGLLLLQRNRTHLLSWSQDRDGQHFSTTSTSFANILSGSTTGWSAASPGAQLDLTYHRTRSANVTPVQLAVYGSSTGGTGVCRLYDGTNNITATLGSTPGWYTATTSIAAGAAKWDIQARHPSGGTVEVHAVSLYELEL